LCIFSLPFSANAVLQTKLKPETNQAFDHYVRSVMEERENSLKKDAFLWIDQQKPGMRDRARRGEVILHRFKEGTKIPDGMIHDWIATVFIPGIKTDAVVSLIKDYDHYKDIYPEAIDSKILAKDGDTVRSFLRMSKKKVFTVVLDTEHKVQFIQVSKGRWYIRSVSTRISEVADVGEPTEHELPVGEGRGFMWRTNSYWRVEQAEDGVFVECDSISLSRNIPWGMGWVIGPYIKSIPRETLIGILQATRKALCK